MVKPILLIRTLSMQKQNGKNFPRQVHQAQVRETGFYCIREADLTGFDRTNAKNLVVFLSDEQRMRLF
jgi:hypothetical protein